MNGADGIVDRLVVWVGADVVDTRKADAWVADMTSALAGLAALAAVAAAAIAKVVASTAEAGNEALSAARKIGVATDALTELRYAASMEGAGDNEAIDGGLKFLGRAVVEAREKAGAAREAFAALGITVADLGTKKLDEIFEQAADGFAATQDAAQRTALAMRLFGTAGTNLVPVLLRGKRGIMDLRKEALELGVAISQDDAEAASALSSTLTQLRLIVSGVARVIGFGLIPHVQKLLTPMVEWWKANHAWVRLRIDKAVIALGYAIDMLNTPLAKLVGLMTALAGLNIAKGFIAAAAEAGKLGGAMGAIGGAFASALTWAGWIGVLALAFDDLATNARGGASVSGDVAAAFGVQSEFHDALSNAIEMMQEFIGLWPDLGQVVTDTVSSILDALGPIGDVLRELGHLIGAVTGPGLEGIAQGFHNATVGFRRYQIAKERASVSGNQDEVKYEFRRSLFGAGARIAGNALSFIPGADLAGSVAGMTIREVGAADRRYLKSAYGGLNGVANVSVNITGGGEVWPGAGLSPQMSQQISDAVEHGQRKALVGAAAQFAGGQR